MSSANPANDAAAQALANRAASGSPLDVLMQQFGQQEAMELLNLLMADLQAGINPRQIAREMSGKLDELSYGRAETIARTESLGSWNDAALENYRANSDVVGQWMWMCEPGAGTCVSCLEEDGTIYDLDEELDDHPNGRCCKMPVTNGYGSILDEYGIPWEEGDFGPAPWEDRESGEDWLLAQDAETQRAAFGSNAAFTAWKSGDVSLADFVGIRHDAAWGDSIYQKSLRSMGKDAKDYGKGSAAEKAAQEAAAAKAAAEREAQAAVVAKAAAEAKEAADFESRFIAEKDVAAWTANNAPEVPSLAYHAMESRASYEAMLRDGIDLRRSAKLSQEQGFLKGLYMTEHPTGAYGEFNVPLAVHMEHPLVLDSQQWQQWQRDVIKEMTGGVYPYPGPLDAKYWADFQQAMLDHLHAGGYDGVIREMGNVREIIAFEPGTVRVIDDAKVATDEQATAAITVDRGNEARQANLRTLFGRDLTDEEIAGLAGALPGSEIRVGPANTLDVYGPHDAYHASLHLTTGEDGKLTIFNWLLRAGPADDARIIAPDARMLDAQVRQARTFGIDTIHTKATADARDHIELARLGYDAPINANFLEETRAKVLPAEFAGARTLGDILQMPGGEAWWADNGISPGLDFITREGSWSSRQLERLLRDRGRKEPLA